MKKLFMLMVFCLTCTMMFAQQTKKNWFKITKESNTSSIKETKKEFSKGEMDQTKWIIESLDKYRKERLTAAQIGLLGVGMGGVSFAFADKPQDQRVLGISAGVLVLMSYFLNMNAERILTKKNLTFTGKGLALRF